eukprot:scaffold173733_cov35-Tisochrysis_lutea.AAC.4
MHLSRERIGSFPCAKAREVGWCSCPQRERLLSRSAEVLVYQVQRGMVPSAPTRTASQVLQCHSLLLGS